MKTTMDPSLPSRLFTIPLDILKHVLDRLTKGDSFRLAHTCKSFMGNPAVLGAIFREPISIAELAEWY